METKRLTVADPALARTLFSVIAKVFEEDAAELSDAYLERLLCRDDVWAIAASEGGEIVGGLTAYTLPMTRNESSEIFIYDIAVRKDHQRKGIGRRLMKALFNGAKAAGASVVFVPADDEDDHALDFHRAVGGVASPVTFFTFTLDKTT